MTFETATITTNMAAVTIKQHDAANRGLLLAAEHVLQVSNTNVPIEDATLERSGTTSTDPANLTSAVSYDTPYAARQHEELDWEHDAGRTAKFLENALNGEKSTITSIIAAEIRKGLGT